MKIDHSKITHHAMTKIEFEQMLDRLFGTNAWTSKQYIEEGQKLYLYYLNASDPLDAHVGTWKHREAKGSWTWAVDGYKQQPNQKENTMKVTKPMLKKFRVDFADAVKDLEEQYGMSITIGNITFDTDSFTSKLKVCAKTADGRTPHESEKYFDEYCRIYGLLPEHKGAIVQVRGEDWRVIGINPRSPKFRFTIQSVNNPDNYLKTTEDSVKRLLGIVSK